MRPSIWIGLGILILIVIAIIAGYFIFKTYNDLIITNKDLQQNISSLNLYNIYNIDITRKGFIPPVIEIQKGDMIVWINQDSIPHRVASKSEEKFDSKNLFKGQNYTRIFDNETEVDYYDIFYPYLKGRITVKTNAFGF